MKKTDIGVVAFFYTVGILFLKMTLELPSAAQTYPIFIIALLMVLNTIFLIIMLMSAKRCGVTSGKEDFEDFQTKQFAVVSVLLIAYLAVMYFTGFYIATLLFMIICLIFLKIPKWQILLTTIVILLLVYTAFTMFLGVKLPIGVLLK